MYLMIQNKGVAPETAYTLLGASNTRSAGVVGTIGKFGTGNKHAISTLLRAGLDVKVYCGKTRLGFQTRPEVVDDGLTQETHQRVVVKFGGTSTRTEDLGWTLTFGSLDWTNLGMALREFVSNALDRTIRENDGEFAPSIACGDLTVTVVDDRNVKAKAGYTRVFVQLDEEGDILRYLAELPKRFLHFSKNPEQVKCGLLTKAGRNLSETATPMIYREGVFVAELKETKLDSLYDYNFRDGEINIDDCRNSNEYAIRGACARRLRRAGADELVPLFQSLTAGGKTFEGELDPYYIMPTWDSAKDEEKENWSIAWQAANGEAVVAEAGDGEKIAKQYAARKGYTIAELPKAWAGVADKFGITTTRQVLSENEKKGREVIDATEAAIAALDEVWEWIEAAEMTGGKDKPGIACYREMTDAECDVMGFYQPGDDKVHTREDISSGRNKYLLKTMLEELAHYVTGSRDCTRDFQNFFMDVIVEYLA